MSIAGLFALNTSPVELVVRGTAMYWFLLLVFRFVLRRDSGSLGIADVLFVVIVADAAQNGMSGSYDTIAEAFVLVGTLVFWNYGLDWLGYHFELARKLTEPPPLLLVDHGKVQRRNLRRELITMEDLQSELRQAGISEVAEVRRAYLEGDGSFSVLRFDETADHSKPRSRLPGAS